MFHIYRKKHPTGSNVPICPNRPAGPASQGRFPSQVKVGTWPDAQIATEDVVQGVLLVLMSFFAGDFPYISTENGEVSMIFSMIDRKGYPI